MRLTEQRTVTVPASEIAAKLLLVLGALLCACSPGAAARAIAKPAPTLGGDGKCEAKGPSEPLVVEWPSPARGRLEAGAAQGVVVVRNEGCTIEVLPQCRVEGGYRFTGFTAKHDVVRIRDADELYANLPAYAVTLEGKLASFDVDVPWPVP